MICILLFFVSAGIMVYELKNKKVDFLQCIPFLSWQFFMVLPFIMQAGKMETDAAALQLIGIEIINFVLVLHLVLVRRHQRKPRRSDSLWMKKINAVLGSGYFYMAIFLLIALYHIISLRGNIPLFEKFRSDPIAAAQMREEAGKLLNVPFFMKYFFRWATNLIAPLAIIAFFNCKHYIMAAVQGVLAVFYAMITTAKSNLLFFVLVLAIYFFVKYYKKITKKMWIGAVVLLMLLLIRPVSFFIASPYSGFHYKVDKWAEEPMAHRMQFIEYPEGYPIDYQKYNYVLRRMILTPAAVSHEWYSYIASGEEFFGYSDLLPSSKSKEAETVVAASPANIVGLWAYSEKWPEKIGQTISANASPDADAYARGGWLGVVISAVILLAVLWILDILRNRDHYVSEGLYTAAMGVLALALPSASVHAMLIAQGILPILLGMGVLFFMDIQPINEDESLNGKTSC